jgi:hypothetical protein
MRVVLSTVELRADHPITCLNPHEWSKHEWLKWVQCSACGMVRQSSVKGVEPQPWLPREALPYTDEQIRQ